MSAPGVSSSPAFGRIAHKPVPREPHPPFMRADMLDRVVGYMRANLTEPIRLKHLADIAHCSPWHFDRVFSHATGLSPMRFVSLSRIELAKLDVMRSDHRIIEIAFDSGYNSLGSFGKRFTELVGLLAAPGAQSRRSLRS